MRHATTLRPITVGDGFRFAFGVFLCALVVGVLSFLATALLGVSLVALAGTGAQ